MRHLIQNSLAAGAPALAALALGACSGEGAAERDPYAGLDEEGQGGAEGCRNFAVACKAEGVLTEAEAAQGGAKVLTAMRWEAWNPETSEFRQTSAAANFLKVGDAWTRSDAPPVTLPTCRPLALGQ